MMQQQQPPQMLNPPAPMLTTEQIQQYLDQNKQLIMAILENQNSGKFAECAPFQAQLQHNLTFLARIADAQSPAPVTPSQATPSQMPPQSAMQQEHYLLPSHVAMSQQQAGFFAPNSTVQLNNQQLQQQQHNAQSQMGMRPGANSSIYQDMQTGFFPNFANVRGSKQEGPEAGTGK